MNPFITSRSTLINIGWPRRLSIDTHGSRRAHLTRAFEEAVSLAIMNNCGLNCAECRLLMEPRGDISLSTPDIERVGALREPSFLGFIRETRTYNHALDNIPLSLHSSSDRRGRPYRLCLCIGPQRARPMRRRRRKGLPGIVFRRHCHCSVCEHHRLT